MEVGGFFGLPLLALLKFLRHSSVISNFVVVTHRNIQMREEIEEYIEDNSEVIESSPVPPEALLDVVIVALENPPIVPDRVNVVAPFGASLLPLM